MSLVAEMNAKAPGLGVPLSVQLDVTYRCNERCVHCYLDHDDHGEMTTAEMSRVLDQLAEAGTFFLTFSGGEVFLRRDFLHLVAHARDLQFNVKMKTNGVLIRAPQAQQLRELGVEQVQISVYSHRAEAHDAITRRHGSLARTLQAIRFLKEQGLKVTIANVLMTTNSRDHAGVQQLAGELGAEYTLDPTITPKNSAAFADVRSIRAKDLVVCRGWSHVGTCTRCPGLAYLEGNMRGPSTADCEKSYQRTGIATAAMKALSAPGRTRPTVRIQKMPAPAATAGPATIVQ